MMQLLSYSMGSHIQGVWAKNQPASPTVFVTCHNSESLLPKPAVLAVGIAFGVISLFQPKSALIMNLFASQY